MNFHIRKLSLAVLIAGSSILTGCVNLGFGNPEYACSGLPEETDQGGVKCMSARKVYEMTERPGPVDIYNAGVDAEQAEAEDDGWWGSSSSKKEAKTPKVAQPVDLAANNAHPLAASPINNDPIPIRSRAKILRIWVAPWESLNGDLNVSGLVFTELEGRRWSVGAQEDAEAPSLTPLQTRALPETK
jgi:conjugal transfer pilus assembly protein TraV